MNRNAKRTLGVLAATLAVGVPGAASAPRGENPRSQATAVRACVEYRQIIGHDAFRAAFENLSECVASVVITSD